MVKWTSKSTLSPFLKLANHTGVHKPVRIILMITRLRLYINTIKYLRFRQIYFRFFYTVFPKLGLIRFKRYSIKDVRLLKPWHNIQANVSAYVSGETLHVDILNLELELNLGENIWNTDVYDKLWNYNLNYFEFLETCDKEEGLKLIHHFDKHIFDLKFGMDPYAVSVRIISWINFMSKWKLQDVRMASSLFSQCLYLKKRIEYHLLGNHVLENAFALTMGGVTFGHGKLFEKGKGLLIEELKEQILNDGGHFELSPMYHQLILYRILNLIDFLNSNLVINEDELILFLKSKASKMLGWLQTITFKNGDVPNVNDSTEGFAPSSQKLFDYAVVLGLEWHAATLKECGYRKFENSKFEIVIDVGQAGPTYQSGHAHADSLNFVLHCRNEPILIDQGVSSYWDTLIRSSERSTKMHNTIIINDQNSSEVWAEFRLANRANVTVEEEKQTYLRATHNGYSESFGVVHEREFELGRDEVIIKDHLEIKKNKNIKAEGHLHFHPHCKPTIKGNRIQIKDVVLILSQVDNISVEEYDCSIGFNRRTMATKVSYQINTNSKISITC